MPRHNLEWSKGPLNTVKRYNHQANYELNTINSIINSSHILNIAFQPAPTDPFPVILPMIGQLGSFTHPSSSLGEFTTLYLHGYVSSRVMNLARSEKGVPLCVSASVLSGLVLTLTPNSHNYNYQSATLFGHGLVVEDVEEKLWAMELITNSVVADRWPNTRLPPNAAEMQSTTILRVEIESASAKVREGVPNDEKVDLERPDVLGKVWTGVLPVYQVIGEPVEGPYNEVKDVPEHVRDFLESQNIRKREYAEQAARKAAPIKRAEKDDAE